MVSLSFGEESSIQNLTKYVLLALLNVGFLMTLLMPFNLRGYVAFPTEPKG